MDILSTILNQLDTTQFVELLVSISKNNPWCLALEQFLNSGNKFKLEKMEQIPIDQSLLLNLPLMLTDLNEYLITRREDHQNKLRKSYFEKSIDYLHAGEKIRSKIMQQMPTAALSGNATSTVADVAGGGAMFKPRKARRIHDIRAMRFKSVNSYWIESNEMVTKFVDDLRNPSKDGSQLEKNFIEAIRLSKLTRVVD